MFFYFKTIGLSFFVSLFILSLAVASHGAVKSHTQVVFSPDGKTFLVAGGNSITIWETDSGRKLHTFTMSSYVGYTVFTPNGKTIFFSDIKNLIWLNAETGKQLRIVPLTKASEYQAISPNGKTLAVRYWIEEPFNSVEQSSEIVKLYDAADGKLKKTFKYPPISTSCISFLPNNRDLLVVGKRKTLLISVKTGRVEKEFDSLEYAWSCGVSADGKAVAVGSGAPASPENDFVQIITVRGNEKYTGLDEKYASLFELANSVGFSPVNPNTAYVASGVRAGKGGVLIVWDIKTGKVKQSYRSKLEIASADYSPDGKTILFNDISDKIFLLDVESGTIIREYVEDGDDKTFTSRKH